MKTRIDGYKVGVVLVVLAAIFRLALAASAHHIVDGGTDEPWSAAMNQETYWELRFGGPGLEVSCTKYERHSGNVGTSYEAVAVHAGQHVRVYPSSPPSQVIGPFNPNSNQHYGAPYSWVMKCNIEQVPDDTTTTQPTTTTSATVAPSSTTTTTMATTSTSENSTTTSTVTDSTTTSTTEPPATTTTAPTESTTTMGPTTTSEQPTTSSVPDASAEWYASGSCYEDGGYIDVEWGDGIVAVDVYMWVDIDLGETPAGWGNPGTRFTEPGSYKTAVGAPTTFLLVPIVTTGYTADPAEIEVLVDRCTTPTSQASSTSAPEAPQTPSTPDLDELPYTGLPVHVWAILGLVALGSGTALVRWARA